MLINDIVSFEQLGPRRLCVVKHPFHMIDGLCHGKRCLRAYADSKGQDQDHWIL